MAVVVVVVVVMKFKQYICGVGGKNSNKNVLVLVVEFKQYKKGVVSKLLSMNTKQPEVNLSTSIGDSTTVTALSTPLVPSSTVKSSVFTRNEIAELFKKGLRLDK